MTDVDPTLDGIFRAETRVLVDEVEARLVAVERTAQALEQEWRALLGALHTVKGNCGMVERDDAEHAAHALEQRAREARALGPAGQVEAVEGLLRGVDALRAMAFGAPSLDSSLRDSLGSDGSEAPRARPEAESRGPRTGDLRVTAAQLDELLELGDDVATYLDRISDGARSVMALRRAVMSLRLVSLRALLGRFDRPVRDLARQTGKQVEVRIRVGDLAVDKQVADRLSEPLLHILRNAVDHGLEAARVRARAGKPEVGVIEIAAAIEAGRLVLEVRDDGKGLDPAALRAAAAARGLDVAGLDDAASLDLVFAAEVSTSREATTLSGRGVGLDQSRRGLEAIGGALTVSSERGAGTCFRLRVPLALALQRALVVRRDDVLYAVPFRATVEVVRFADGELAPDALRWRGHEVPLVAPPDEHAGAASRLAVLVARGGDTAAVVVDAVLGHQDVTIRELDALFGRPRGIAGAALLRDGRIALVLDPDALGHARSRAAA